MTSGFKKSTLPNSFGKRERRNLKKNDLNYLGDAPEHSMKALTTYKTQKNVILKPIRQFIYPNRTTIKTKLRSLCNIKKYQSSIYQITSAKHSLIDRVLDMYFFSHQNYREKNKKLSKHIEKRHHKHRRHNLINLSSGNNNS